jgi:hypothetical protein
MYPRIGIGIPTFRSTGGGAPPAPSLLLDDYPDAAAAYSLRQLRTAYTGPAITLKVLDGGANPEHQIFFDGSGELDTTQIQQLCGPFAGVVAQWYDQSGNNRHASQTNILSMPKIYQVVEGSGSVINVNSKPAIQFTNTNANCLNISSNFWTYTGDSTVFHTSINRNSSLNQFGSVISYFENPFTSLGLQWQQFPNSTTQACTDFYAPGGMSTSGTQSVNTQYLATFQWQNWSTHKTNGNTIIAINGLNQSLTAYGSNPSSWANNGVTKIGRFNNTTTHDANFLGDIQEIVIYTSALSGANMDGAESNINTYYGIY